MALTKVQLGEVRQFAIEITNLNNEVFQIDSADFKVYMYEDKDRLEVIDEGYCDVIEHKIVALFNAKMKGTFVIEITYRIKPEILKADIMVMVS